MTIKNLLQVFILILLISLCGCFKNNLESDYKTVGKLELILTFKRNIIQQNESLDITIILKNIDNHLIKVQPLVHRINFGFNISTKNGLELRWIGGNIDGTFVDKQFPIIKPNDSITSTITILTKHFGIYNETTSSIYEGIPIGYYKLNGYYAPVTWYQDQSYWLGYIISNTIEFEITA